MIDNMETATTMTHDEYASKGKANAALTTGIIGTALGALNMIGGGMALTNWGKSTDATTPSAKSGLSNEEVYIERQMAQNYIDITKEFYEGKLQGQKDLTNAFFDAYQRDVDNSFKLYKNHRDDKDEVMGLIWTTNSVTNKKIDDAAFNLYKNHRDDKDALNEKISKLQSQVDVMAAIRPYQDALINAKIDKNALVGEYNLARRTCRMIEGELVLPNDPTITGFKGADSCNCGN